MKQILICSRCKSLTVDELECDCICGGIYEPLTDTQKECIVDGFNRFSYIIHQIKPFLESLEMFSERFSEKEREQE